MVYDHAWIEELSQRFLNKIYSRLKHVIRNGDPEQTYLGCINLSFAYVEGMVLNLIVIFCVLVKTITSVLYCLY